MPRNMIAKIIITCIISLFSLGAITQPTLADGALPDISESGQNMTPNTIQPLPFDVYINNHKTKVNQAILYQGHTYVQLRELSGLLNAHVEFYPNMPMGGMGFKGINVMIPTFVYVDKKVADYKHIFSDVGDGTYFPAVDITGLCIKYSVHNKIGNVHGFRYYFRDNGETEFVVNENGEEKVEKLRLHSYAGHYYIPVPDFKRQIQPYLTDMCMQ